MPKDLMVRINHIWNYSDQGVQAKLNMDEYNLVKAVSRKTIQEFNSGKKYNILTKYSGIVVIILH